VYPIRKPQEAVTFRGPLGFQFGFHSSLSFYPPFNVKSCFTVADKKCFRVPKEDGEKSALSGEKYNLALCEFECY
jgi:hypothetical protein